jgi:hypothetical protein
VGTKEALKDPNLVAPWFAIDNLILEGPILGFRGVPQSLVRVEMLTGTPKLPEYVLEKKRQILEPKPNHKKVYFGGWIPPLSDTETHLVLRVGTTDFWTSVSVEESIERIHEDIRAGKLDWRLFPRQLVCHVVVLSSDDQLMLCRRSDEVRYERLAWSASFEESIDALKDLDHQGNVNPSMTVRRALGVDEELGLPEPIVNSADVTFIALGTEWTYMSTPLIVLVRLPNTSATEIGDYFLAAHDREHVDWDAVPFTVEHCIRMLSTETHAPAGRPGARDRWHGTTRFRILCAAFSKFGYPETLSSL